MQEMQFFVPTSFGDSPTNSLSLSQGPARDNNGNNGEMKPGRLGDADFGEPFVPVVIYNDVGIRIVLGTTDRADLTCPDAQIERLPNGWAIFLYPLGGGDPSGMVYFLDDGRSFLVKEPEIGATPPIEVHADRENIPDLR